MINIRNNDGVSELFHLRLSRVQPFWDFLYIFLYLPYTKAIFFLLLTIFMLS